jgi:hypothetical protein
MIDQDKEYGDTAYPIVFITRDAKTVDVYGEGASSLFYA